MREYWGANLFDSTQTTLCCPINAAGAMGAGLALAFKERYPGLESIYHTFFPPTTLSTLARSKAYRLVSVPVHDGHRVLLFCTKFHFSEPANVELIKTNLQQLKRDWVHLKIDSLALPPLGCGLGRLSYFQDVRPLIMQCLSGLDVNVIDLKLPGT